jgi:cytochrome oxidase Cu insertion factor (SCO1/SenC/PrrC family)
VLGALAAFLVYRPIARRPGLVVAAVQAPEFSLEDQKGTTVTLASLTANGPAVLVFYRGFW